jgi:hypothetical protein
MKKRILIIDDDIHVIKKMAEIAKKAKYEVLAIFVEEKSMEVKGLTRETKPERIIELAQLFNADIVLLDHDLCLNSPFSGEYFAREMAVPKEKLVGISSVIDQTYCNRQWRDKKMLPYDEPVYEKAFLDLLR